MTPLYRVALCVVCAIGCLVAQEGATFGSWAVEKKTSPLTGRESTGIVSAASEADRSFSSRPSLMVNCSPKKDISVYLRFGGMNLDIRRSPNGSATLQRPHTIVRVQHDKEKAYDLYGLVIAPAGSARPETRVVLPMITKKWFENVGRTSALTVELALVSGGTAVAVFPVTQFTEALKSLPDGCK